MPRRLKNERAFGATHTDNNRCTSPRKISHASRRIVLLVLLYSLTVSSRCSVTTGILCSSIPHSYKQVAALPRNEWLDLNPLSPYSVYILPTVAFRLFIPNVFFGLAKGLG